MSDRSGSAEGSGDEIRPHGEDHDSSEESEDDPEEAKRIAEGFIVDEDDDDDDDEDEDEDGRGKKERKVETKEERRRRKREAKRKRREEREARKREQQELSDDELDLLNENTGGIGGPSSSHRPAKRARQDQDDDGTGLPRLQDMFADDVGAGGAGDEDDDDDLGDFIEESEEEAEEGGETEEQRKERRRLEKVKRREAKKAKPDAAGVDKVAWDEIHDVFGDGTDFDWALDAQANAAEDEDEMEAKKNLRLEDVFDPAEIKERRLQDEDRILAQRDRPERHQLVNSTLSDNPVIAPDTIFPDPDLAAHYAWTKISPRTQWIFCGRSDIVYPKPTIDYPTPTYVYPRPDLTDDYFKAVSRALNMMFVQHLEVPYLWHYKRDAFSVLENAGKSAMQFLDRDELWKLYELGIRFRAIYERNQATRTLWEKIKSRRDSTDEMTNDERYFETKLLDTICTMSIEAAAEGGDWLGYHFAKDIARIKEDESIDEVVKKLPTRAGNDDLRTGPIMRLVKAFGVSVPVVADTFNQTAGEPVPPTNAEQAPLDLAAEFSGEGTPFSTPEIALKAASQILTTEFFKDPTIRQQARDFIKACAVITVNPTDKGMSLIDEYHLYYTFKFLTNKPIAAFEDSPQFLHMLQAEEEGLIDISIELSEEMLASFADALIRCCRSNAYGEASQQWNAIREEVCWDLVRRLLVPMGQKWLRDQLRGEAETYVGEGCRAELEFRVNVRPYQGRKMESGETPSVLAITTGRGDIRDAVIAIVLDQEGNIQSQNKFDNLKDDSNREAFCALLAKRTPNVVAIGGLSVHTAKLREDASNVLRDYAIQQLGENPPVVAAYDDPVRADDEMAQYEEKLHPFLIPLMFPQDATARLYMTSEEAEKEHPTLPLNGRYALALARYTQNPLNAYCKIGRSIASVTFLEHHQKLLSNEKLLIYLERGLVNAVCSTGIEVNSCVADPYERIMLPFIAGLGPRKADVLINAVLKQGSFVNRLGYSDYFGPTIFENVAGFLTIETDLSNMMLEEQNPQEQPDPLDRTRVHPEDYEFAQKMCQDALDLDAEDVADQHKSEVVLQLMLDNNRAGKLSELNLDDFAFNLQKQGEGNKRYALGEIVGELIAWRADRRPQFYVPSDWEVVQMLTGETERTIGRGLQVTATVRKALSGRAFCQLESGMDALIEREYIQDEDGYSDMPSIRSCEDVLKPRQAIKAVVIEAEPRRFQVRISTRASDLKQAVPFVQPFKMDDWNDKDRRIEAEAKAELKKRKKQGSTKRMVQHPNWHDMNSGQAELFLASQQRGDVVIRRSSKGPDHLAITWKVDDEVFQHLDVEEIDKPNEFAVGRILKVGKYTYMDLDDLIINHVKATARKFDEMQMHEKYRPEHELENYLKNYVLAHPGKSMYGFSVDSEKPGYLRLCFLNKATRDGGVVQTWPVKVLPGAYRLNNAEVPGVMELCNAFKAQYSSRLMDQGTGGKTPGIRVGRTPMGGRTPGGRTPAVGGRGGATPMFAGGRTPMPGQSYGAPPMSAYGGGQGNRTPHNGYPHYGGAPGGPGYPPPSGSYGMPPPPQGGAGGYGMPPPGPPHQRPPPPASGMNPERAAMIARQQGGPGRY